MIALASHGGHVRVLLFHPRGRFDPADCGASHTAFAQLEFFQSCGWEVHCVFQEIPAWGVGALEDEVMSRFACVKSVRTVRIDCPPVAPRHYGDEFRQLLYATERAARGKVFRAVAAEEWDAFFTTDVTCTPYAMALSRAVFRVLAAGDSYARRATATEIAPRPVREAELLFTFARVECELYRLFDRILFLSETEVSEASRCGVKNAMHVPPMIRASDSAPRETQDKHDLVICGGELSGDLADVEWFYRHVYLPHLRACGVRLTLAGPAAARFPLIDQRVPKLPASTEVYHAARVVVVPACEATGPHVPAMNAFAAGRAVVATPLALRALEVPENAAVVIEMRTDPAGTAAAILELLASHARRTKLGERAAETASRHTRERHFAALEAAWQREQARLLPKAMERSREC